MVAERVHQHEPTKANKSLLGDALLSYQNSRSSRQKAARARRLTEACEVADRRRKELVTRLDRMWAVPEAEMTEERMAVFQRVLDEYMAISDGLTEAFAALFPRRA